MEKTNVVEGIYIGKPSHGFKPTFEEFKKELPNVLYCGTLGDGMSSTQSLVNLNLVIESQKRGTSVLVHDFKNGKMRK